MSKESEETGWRAENHIPGGGGLANIAQSGVVEWADQRIQSCALLQRGGDNDKQIGTMGGPTR